MGMPKGTKLSAETKRKMSLSRTGEKNPNWRGDAVGYHGLHHWLRRTFGVANKCEVCAHEGLCCEWANLTGEYLRQRDDWKMMCPPCHREHDKTRGRSKRLTWSGKKIIKI